MRILILGGDGYLGWPQSLYLSSKGHDITIFDNLMRRHFDLERGFDSLMPIYTLHERVAAWKEVSGRQIQMRIGDTMDYEALAAVFRDVQPQAVVHFAEQRSAPYSMIDRKHAVFTQTNNVVGTLNVLYAMKEFAPDCHLVKLGTMGEYGTPNIDIEEGFIEIHHKGRSDVLPFPKQPGSFYHLSKTYDSHNIMFCCKIWGLRATDLNQGVVYGKGQQIRGYINLRDTIRCIELAITSPAGVGEYRVFNQITEQFSLVELAEMVLRESRRFGLEVQVKHLPNPRVEAERHYYNAAHTKLIDLGLEPHLLDEAVLEPLIGLAIKHRERIDRNLIMPTVNWRMTKNEISQADS